MAKDEIGLRITAKDDASKTLDKIDKKADKLDGTDVEITVDAKVNKAISALDDVAAEARKTQKAADALSAAVGPDLAKGANMDAVVTNFRDMGLSLDDITANADKLGGKLRELGDTGTSGLEASFGRARTGVDEIGKSAGSSRNALANMVGNTTQDLGQLGGVAGSAGVAIGQMAEFMADAAFEGESLGAVFASFAAVAGPMAALAAATLFVQGVMEKMSKQKAFNADEVKAFTDALTAGGDQAAKLEERLRTVGEIKFEAPPTNPWNFWFGNANDAIDLLERSQVSVEQFTKGVSGTSDAANDLYQVFRKANEQGLISTQDLKDAQSLITQYYRNRSKAAQDAIQANKVLAVSQNSVNDSVQELIEKRDPVQKFPQAFERMSNALAANLVPSVKDVTDVMTGLGVSEEETLAIAEQLAETKLDDFKKQTEDAAKAQEEAAKQAKDWAINIDNAQTSLDEMSSTQATMSRRKGAISDAFDFGNTEIEALGTVHSIHDAIGDLYNFIAMTGVPDLSIPSLDATNFLSKLAALRGPIQDEIARAFEFGGPEAAQKTTDAWVDEVFRRLDGKLTKDQIVKSLGLDNVQATIKVAVDKASLEEATGLLEVLTGVGGEDVWTADIKLALAGGTLSSDAAKTLIAQRLTGLGLDVPTTLVAPPDADKEAVQAEADTWASTHPFTLPSTATAPSDQDLGKAQAGAQTYMDNNPAVLPVDLDTSEALRKIQALGEFIRDQFKDIGIGGGALVPLDQGGTAGGLGGIAGERGPEIVNGRYLVTRPTYIPPGTRVTSRRRTEQIMRHHGTRGLKRYDAGGVVPTVANVTLNAAVIGSTFDVMHAVNDAVRRANRLLPRNS